MRPGESRILRDANMLASVLDASIGKLLLRFTTWRYLQGTDLDYDSNLAEVTFDPSAKFVHFKPLRGFYEYQVILAENVINRKFLLYGRLISRVQMRGTSFHQNMVLPFQQVASYRS